VDIYALGVIMYRLLTGEMPFKNDNDNQRMLMRLYTEPQKPRDVCPSIPVELEGVILRAMERDWNRRYQTVSELKAAIEACMPKGSAPGIRSDDFVLSNILNALDGAGRASRQAKHLRGGRRRRMTRPTPSRPSRIAGKVALSGAS
jgi:serine/threonine-protein kinase